VGQRSIRGSVNEGVDGVSVAIVKDGQVLLAKGYGAGKMGEPGKEVWDYGKD
jgi:CubicO group peptidase (beta-lactamase class C family)